MAIYYIDGTYGNDSTGNGSAATPWKSITKYHESVFYNAASIDDVLVLSGVIAPNPSTETGLGTHGAWLAGSRILDFGNTNGNTAKSAGSKLTIRARTRFEAAPTGGVTRPPIISPWIQCTGSVTSDGTTTGVRTISTQTANLPTYASFASNGRIARVAYRPYDPNSVSSQGLPACRFRRVMAAQALVGDAATAVAAAILLSSGSTDDGTTGMNIGTFVHNSTNNTIIINAATAANGATVHTNIGSGSTTVGNWYFSVDDNGGVTGLGIQCNPSNGAGADSVVDGVTFMDCVSSVGTGHSLVGFDAPRMAFRNIRVINAGSHAIAISNSNATATTSVVIEDFEIDGLAGGANQGNSAVLVGGNAVGSTISGVRVRRGSMRLFNLLRADSVPLARAALTPFLFQAGIGLATAGVLDVSVDDVNVAWLPGLTADTGVVTVRNATYSGELSSTPIFGGGGNMTVPTNPTDFNSYPLRFNRCTFTGGKCMRMDSGSLATNNSNTDYAIISAAFLNCVIDASDYGRSRDSGMSPPSGNIGVLSFSNGGKGRASGKNCFLFQNSVVIGRCGGTGTTSAERHLIQANGGATFDASRYLNEIYFRNSVLGLADIRDTTGSVHGIINYGVNAASAFLNGIYLDVERSVVFYHSTGLFNEAGGIARSTMYRDANAAPRWYNNTYWNMDARNSAGTSMSFGRNSTIGNIRGNWTSGTGGDALAKIEIGPLPFLLNRTSLLPIVPPYSDAGASGAGVGTSALPFVPTSIHPLSRRPL